MNLNTHSQSFLYDICIIRIILILLLIIYHSLCPFTSAFWDNPQGQEIQLYYWIGRLSYSCMLETFVFISGIILGYQTERKGARALSFKYLVTGKIRRLILPSIIFGVIYFLLFLDLSSAPISVFKCLLEGVGHMWFLPMLFWCFVAMFVINILRANHKEILPILLIFAIFSSLPLPLRMNQSLYYFFFFYLGYCIGSKQINIARFFNKKSIVFTFVVFAITFPLLAHLRYDYDEIILANKIGGYLADL